MALHAPQFIGWSSPLAQGVAARLTDAGRQESGRRGLPLDLGNHRVIIPSSFASRLIQEELAKNTAQGILLPEFQTPDKFLNWGGCAYRCKCANRPRACAKVQR